MFYYHKHDTFFFIECFTTTFLRAHSWLNWVDEDDDEHDEVNNGFCCKCKRDFK